MASEERPRGDQIRADNPIRPNAAEFENVRRLRTRDQVAAIVDSLGGPAEVGVVGLTDAGRGTLEVELSRREDFGAMAYMFHRGRILVRDAHLDRVLRVLPNSAVMPGGIDGLSSLTVDDTLAALADLDRELGAGIGHPEHVVHLTPVTGSGCPATEPWPPRSPEPFPTRQVHGDCDGEGVHVAFVDTGFDPELAARTPWLAGIDGDAEVNNPLDLERYAGHGTFAAGVARLMAPRLRGYVHGMLPKGGGARFESDLVVEGFAKALTDKPDIVSISAGTYTRDDHGLLGMQVAWERFGNPRTAVIAAAGNDAQSKPFFPAAADFAVGVGALDQHGGRAYYSNFGSWVDCYALGSELVNAYPEGIYIYKEHPLPQPDSLPWAEFHGLAVWSGTSFATPLVSGIVTARKSWSGESGRAAVESVLALAQANTVHGVGPVVEPWMACRPDWQCGC